MLALALLAPTVAAADALSPSEAIAHVGETAQVCGRVASATYAVRSKGRPTFLNLGKAYPNHEFTAVIWGSTRSAFSYTPESLRGQTVCVRGTINTYRHKAQIIVSDPAQIERDKH